MKFKIYVLGLHLRSPVRLSFGLDFGASLTWFRAGFQASVLVQGYFKVENFKQVFCLKVVSGGTGNKKRGITVVIKFLAVEIRNMVA